MSRWSVSLPIIVFAAVVSLLATFIASFSNKGKVTIDNKTYEEKGSFNIIVNKDDYIRQTTTRVRIASNNTSSGGSRSGVSSTHRSSSGRTHGGGGRKF